MLFNSTQFIFLFLPLTLVASLVMPRRRLLAWVTLMSCVFYALMGQLWFLAPMAATVIIDYAVGRKIADDSISERRRKLLLCISISANVGLLVAFKYSYFFAENAVGLVKLLTGHGRLPGWAKHLEFILPAGISFYTFQTLSYIIDVWKRRCPPERDFFRFTSFVTFFPHLVAGPLTRHSQLIPQLAGLEKGGVRPRWQSGVLLFAMGLCKKVLIADQLASIIDPKIAAIGDCDMVVSWLVLLGYTFQIYFDFSGYSEMAIGLGRLWGIELPLNFDGPYRAANPSDFWRRWHITLSQWLRDYVYIPLGGNKAGENRRDVNVMMTMCLGGLWHGASWTFVLWGVYHGALLVLHRRRAAAWERLSAFNQRNLMFFLAVIGWLFFRADNFSHLVLWTKGLVGLRGVVDAASYGPWWRDCVALSGLVTGALLISRIAPPSIRISAGECIRPAYQVGFGFATAVAVVLMSHSSHFLYFRF